MVSDTHFQRLETLVRGALSPPPGAGRIALALTFGVAVHLAFAVAVAAMILAMYFGMSRSLGSVSWPYAYCGQRFSHPAIPAGALAPPDRPRYAVADAFGPGPHAETLSTTTYALVASLQLLALVCALDPIRDRLVARRRLVALRRDMRPTQRLGDCWSRPAGTRAPKSNPAH